MDQCLCAQQPSVYTRLALTHKKCLEQSRHDSLQGDRKISLKSENKFNTQKKHVSDYKSNDSASPNFNLPEKNCYLFVINDSWQNNNILYLRALRYNTQIQGNQ